VFTSDIFVILTRFKKFSVSLLLQVYKWKLSESCRCTFMADCCPWIRFTRWFCGSKRGRKRSFELDFGPCQHAYVFVRTDYPASDRVKPSFV